MTNRDYLFSLEHFGIKLGLDQIRSLLDGLGHPDCAFRSIVIAGTNGKGSVTAMVERALRAAGYRTGRYTSPHLVDLEERFVIDGDQITPDALEAVAGRVKDVAGHLALPPTFFEATTAVALEAFRDAAVNVAVLEVGLGGRLDATNAVEPIAVAITSIDFDHEQYLGHTIEAIASEKAAIIKNGCFAVLARNPPAVRAVVEARARAENSPLVYAPDDVRAEARLSMPGLKGWPTHEGKTELTVSTSRGFSETVTLGLRGRHQIDNAVAALRLLEELDARGILRVPQPAIHTGLTDVVWPARLELRRWREGRVLIDGAHNPAGARALASYLDEAYGRPLPVVFGAMRDKHVDGLVAGLAPAASHFVITAPATPRAATPSEISAVARAIAPDVTAHEFTRPMDALAFAATLGDPVIVAGSLYLAGEIRAELS